MAKVSKDFFFFQVKEFCEMVFKVRRTVLVVVERSKGVEENRKFTNIYYYRQLFTDCFPI